MVLKAKTPAAAAATPAAVTTKPSFEGMDDNAVEVLDNPETTEAAAATSTPVEEEVAAAVVGTTSTAPASEADAAAETKTVEATERAADAPKEVKIAEATAQAIAVVAAAKTGVAVSVKFVGALAEKENQFDPRTLDFNTFPRVTVGLDGFSSDDGEDLGKVIGIEVMSFNERFVASPGDDSEEAKKHARYSLDGKTIDSTGDDNGADIFDYISELKTTHGYDDAGLKKYLSIYGFLTFANDAEIAPEDREIIALQVPPQSRALFTRHQMTHGVKIQRKLVEASDIIICRQEKKQGGNKKFALINFAAK